MHKDLHFTNTTFSEEENTSNDVRIIGRISTDEISTLIYDYFNRYMHAAS